MKYATICLISIFLTGCGEQEKLVSACKMAVQVVVGSPTVEFLDSDFVESGVAQADIEGLYVERRSGSPMSPAVKRYINILYKEGNDTPKQYWVDLRLKRPHEDAEGIWSAGCRFVRGTPDDVFLLKATVAGKSYRGSDLLMLQVRNGVPDKLTKFLY